MHELARAICPTMIAAKRAHRAEEHAAISGALALLTNLVMAWNTHRLQEAWDAIEPGERDPLSSILGRISPAAYRHINFRGIFQFPLTRYRAKLFAQFVDAGAGVASDPTE